MKFLVTGGAGFIGSNYMHYVTNKYPEDYFVCLDALTYAGNYNNIKDLEGKDNYKFVKGDITDKDFIDKLFEEEQFDVVINFAAESHVDNSIKNPRLFLMTNIIGTQTLMDASRKYGVKRYHQVSTDEVYGDLPLDRPDLLFKETTPLHTSSPYSSSKASADLLVMAYHRTYGLPVTISRCSNNYGPYQFPEKLIPVVISKALNDEKIPVYGKGENVRDWIHVIDHNIGVDLIVRNGKVGEVYNLGGHSERTNLEVVKTILKQLGKSEDLIEYVTDRPGHDLRYAIDSTKVENELGWNRTYTFETGIKETIDWYVNNTDWIENIKSGDVVWSFDSETLEVSQNYVDQVLVHKSNDLVKITIGNEIITATSNHPFYVVTKGFISALDLRAGDILITVNGERVVVEKVQHEILEAPVDVYNFSIRRNHTYFVGTAAVGVHNAGGPCSNNGEPLPNSSSYINKSPTKANKLALGVREYLYEFAEEQNAYTWKDFADTANWQDGVRQALYDPEMEISFNLDGIDSPRAAIQRGASGRCTATEWELFEIYQSKSIWGKITWYLNGEVVPNPFE